MMLKCWVKTGKHNAGNNIFIWRVGHNQMGSISRFGPNGNVTSKVLHDLETSQLFKFNS